MKKLSNDLLDWVEAILPDSGHQTRLNSYIQQHNPKCTADVERLIKEFTYGNLRIWL